MIQNIHGYFEKYLFRNALDGFTIFTFKAGDERLVLKGVVPNLLPFVPLHISYENNGSEFIVTSIEPNSIGVDRNAVKNYLLGLGFDEATSLAISKKKDNIFHFGTGLTAYDVKLFESFSKLRTQSTIGDCLVLKDMLPNVPLLYIERFVEDYPSQWRDALNKDFVGIALKYFAMPKEDLFARVNKSNLDEAQRVKEISAISAREFLLSLKKKQESTVSMETFKSHVERDIGTLLTPDQVKNIIKAVGATTAYGRVVVDQEIWGGEVFIASEIRRSSTSNQQFLFKDEEIQAFVKKKEKELGIKYHEAQKDAFSLLKTSGIKILTGGPGTGKTTVLKGIIACYVEKYGESLVQLCAPTGRASQRMTEATGRPACTLHHLMVQTSTIESKLIVIDESSMLDISLASWLLRAAPADALIILVGDIDQLPSVGPGHVLRDLLSAGVETRRLARTFRNDGSIVENAYKVRDGNTALIQDSKFQIYRPDDLLTSTQDKYLELLKGHSVFDVQILCPSYKGSAGITALNASIQNAINPKRAGVKSAKFGKSEFREGDKIICLHNNYTKGYFNGDVGLVKNVGERTVTIVIAEKEIELGFDELGEIALAYAITIHKSQGSEFKHVICVLQKSAARNLLQKSLVFTAISRAKESCYIYSEQDALEMAILSKNDDAGGSITGLLYA